MPTGASRTDFSLYIVESLRFDDEADRCEGRILRDILRLSDHTAHYMYIRTKRELEEALNRFQRANSRYLHLSSHGDQGGVQLTLDSIKFADFGRIIRPFLRNRRLFVSACEVVNDRLAKAVLPGSGCYSLIGPSYSMNMDDAVLVWASFYHLMFRDTEINEMKGGRMRWALRRIRDAFKGKDVRSDLSYARPAENAKGYEWVDIEERVRNHPVTRGSGVIGKVGPRR